MTPHPPQKLLTLSSGGWVILLSVALSLISAALVLYPVYTTGGHRAIGDGRNVDSYGFDLSNLTIPKLQLIASGKAKDEVRAIPPNLVETITPEQADLIAANEHIRFLVPSDQIIGVTINGQSRAYPVRILNLHEIVNDDLAGTPIAVTWSPLCGSAAVFDRRLSPSTNSPATAPSATPATPSATSPVEFGVSGLLYNANLILFDRHSDAKDESLWPQLSFHAIAGPAAKSNRALTILPFQLTTWDAWRKAHPDTRIFLGLRTLKFQYTDAQDPFNMYLSNDNVAFPLSHLWPHPTPPNKTPLTLTSTDNGHSWKATLSSSPSPTTSPTTQPAPIHLYSFLFAWYAQHPDDTDYSALTGK